MESPRARRMGDRVAEALVRAGRSSEQVSRIGRAYTEAILAREGGDAALPSDRHPAFLHPGRTILILLDDLDEDRPVALAAAALAESRDIPLRVSFDQARGWDEEAARLQEELPEVPWRAVDREDADAVLLEELVTAPTQVRRIALAEALDQIRHAHLWERPGDRARAAELTRRVFAPTAERTHPTLARRFRWWERRVAPALSRGVGPGE